MSRFGGLLSGMLSILPLLAFIAFTDKVVGAALGKGFLLVVQALLDLK